MGRGTKCFYRLTQFIIVPTLRVGMRLRTLQRLRLNPYFIADALTMKTLERQLRRSNAERWNDTYTSPPIWLYRRYISFPNAKQSLSVGIPKPELGNEKNIKSNDDYLPRFGFINRQLGVLFVDGFSLATLLIRL